MKNLSVVKNVVKKLLVVNSYEGVYSCSCWGCQYRKWDGKTERKSKKKVTREWLSGLKSVEDVVVIMKRNLDDGQKNMMLWGGEEWLLEVLACGQCVLSLFRPFFVNILIFAIDHNVSMLHLDAIHT